MRPQREDQPHRHGGHQPPDAARDAMVVSEATDGAVDQVMRSVVRTYDRSRFSADHLRGLARSIGSRLAGGYTTSDLVTVLTSNPDGMRIPGRALLRRLEDLDDRDQLVERYAASTRRPWCGQCHERTRMLEGSDRVRRCPDCHPNASPTTSATAGSTATPGSTAVAGSVATGAPPPGDRKHVPWRQLLAEGSLV